LGALTTIATGAYMGMQGATPSTGGAPWYVTTSVTKFV
jgi:hypothetical protein